jgi:glycosyltransferase involved in cell wall biosynthesis
MLTEVPWCSTGVILRRRVDPLKDRGPALAGLTRAAAWRQIGRGERPARDSPLMRATTVLYGAFYPQLGGAELALLGLLDALDRDRFRPVVLTGGRGPLVDELGRRSVPVLVEPRMRFIARRSLSLAGIARFVGSHAAVVRALVRAGEAHRVGLVHAFVVAALGYAGRAGRAASVPVVGTVHEPLGSFVRPRRWLLVPALNRLCDRVTVPSNASGAEAIRYGLRADRLSVVRTGIDVARFRPDPEAGRRVRAGLGIPPDAPLVGMVARFNPGKGHDVLLRAMAIVARSFPDARCLVVGDALFEGEGDWRAQMVTLARALRLGDRAVFAGWRDDVPAVLQALDVLVHAPTAPDSMPTVVMEAMAAGRPVVGAALGGVPELVADGVTGRLVPPRDPDALATALHPLLDDPAARAALGAAARDRAVRELSRERFARAMAEVYETVLDAKRPVR